MISETTKALIVEATAGSGKTTTIVDGLAFAKYGLMPKKVLPNGTEVQAYKVSEEQKDIWEWLEREIRDGKCENVLVCSFSKAIAETLKERLKFGEASTIHSLGCKVMRENGIRTKLNNGFKTINLFLEYTENKDLKTLSKDMRTILDDVKEVVKMCKDNVMTENDVDELSLRTMFIDREYEAQTATDVLVPIIKYILENGSKLPEVSVKRGPFDKGSRGGILEIDYDDMIYIPARYDFHTKFDMMIIDESQDVSYGKLKLILGQDCDRYVYVGDPNQAIMAFAGAMCNSMEKIHDSIENVEVLPLSYTYRCGKAIVAEAKKIVGDAINAGEGNCEGKISYIKESEMELEVGDMLVSRVNAPLMSLAWRLVKEKKNVLVVGHEIGVGLVRLINKQNPKDNDDVIVLCSAIEEWREHQIKILQNKKADTSGQQINVNDKADCIIAVAGECHSVKLLKDFIKLIFDNNLPCIRLSSIHRAKGLEAKRVFFYDPSIVPHKMAKSREAKKQEMNLKFVAITRAIEELVYVEVEKKQLTVEI